MSGKQRNIERGRERHEHRTERCDHCHRMRQPGQVWRPCFDSTICIDEAGCLMAAQGRVTAAITDGLCRDYRRNA